jgi:hypothetical protein
MNEKRQSALKTALLEFVVVFVTASVWNLVRKTGESVVDAFFIAVITAVFLYALHREKLA